MAATTLHEECPTCHGVCPKCDSDAAHRCDKRHTHDNPYGPPDDCGPPCPECGDTGRVDSPAALKRFEELEADLAQFRAEWRKSRTLVKKLLDVGDNLTAARDEAWEEVAANVREEFDIPAEDW